MKALRRLLLRIFPRFERLDLQVMSYSDADKRLRAEGGRQDGPFWRIAKEEDTNRAIGYVYLERVRRVLQ